MGQMLFALLLFFHIHVQKTFGKLFSRVKSLRKKKEKNLNTVTVISLKLLNALVCAI